MNFDEFIGYPIDFVKQKLDDLKIKYKIAESSDIQKKYDTILVTKIVQKDDFVKIVTDRFLLYI